MATTIEIKYSGTATNTPGILSDGELAVNAADKNMWVGHGGVNTLIASPDADTLGAQAGSYYLDVTNHTGTIPSARLTGSYAISISGNAATATLATNATDAADAALFNGQAASFYNDAANLTGTVASARLTGSYPNVNAGEVDGKSISVLTQVAYDALTPDADTLYFIVG